MSYSFLVNVSKSADWLKLYDDNADIDSIRVRDVECCGQKYITYLSNDGDDLYQYVIVRGTKNWKNIKSSLQYSMTYNDEFGMYLHNGYGMASNAILQDLRRFIDPNAKLRLTGHSYGGVVCCVIGTNVQKTSLSEIDQIVTFGMPQFSGTKQMNQISQYLPLIQVQHIRDEIAKLDWNRIVNKQNNKSTSLDRIRIEEREEKIVYVGHLDDYKNTSLKTRFVHRMNDYVQSIAKHNDQLA